MDSLAIIPKSNTPSLALSAFIREAWHVVEPGTVYKSGWHIDAICEHLEAVTRGEIRNLIINMPPRHMKSLTVSVFWPMWVWAWWPEARWLFSSYADTLATRDSLKCRRIIQSQWYQSNWGDVFQLTSDQNQKTRFENDKTGYRVSSGVGGMSTGEGGDFIVVDDPIKAIDASSKAQRDSVIEWWDQSMSTRLNDPDRSGKVIVMQRLHEEDLTGYLLDKMRLDGEHYEHLCLPAEYEPTVHVTAIGWSDPRTQANELLWPERFGSEALSGLKRALGSYGTAGQLQQRPAPAEGGILKRTYWRFWTPKGVQLPAVTVRMADGSYFECPQVEIPDMFEEVLQSWDMTFKDTKSSDYVAGGVWALNGANKYMLDLIRQRMDIIKTIDAVMSMSLKWPDAQLKLVEDKANGPAVIGMLHDKVVGLVAYDPKTSKEGRVNAVAPQIESGNVYLPHPAIAAWVNGFIDECAAFPNGAHDDQVDQMTQALLRWQTGNSWLLA